MSACGGTIPPASPESVAPAAAPAVAATPALAGPGSFVVSDRSAATIRVRETLVSVRLESDAVLTVRGVAGGFRLDADGTFSPESKITADLTTIRSDEGARDSFIKRDPLEVSRFPRAEFVPTRTSGLATPLPASGDFAFKLFGGMTIHGTTREVTFDVKAKREGRNLTATATAAPTWKFGDFGMRPPVSPTRVLSVVDEIRLDFELVATEAAP